MKNQIRVVVGGMEIAPASVELAPGTMGLLQVDAPLPLGVPSGDTVPLFVRVILSDGTTVESNEVTLAIDGGSG